MSPKRALIILTTINYLNYIDRLILAAVLGSIKKDLSLDDFQAGLLATMFMLPYMLTSPLFGYLGDTRNRSRLIAMGTGLWSIATFCTGLAKSFPSLLATRFALGIGESAFTTISMPYLSEYFPASKHGRIFAIFNTAAPVGAALGYLLGGLLSSLVGWRNAFLIVGLPGLILAAIMWRAKDPRHSEERHFNIKEAFTSLRSSKSYIFAVLGFCANTFVIGGVAHWMPSFIQRTFQMNELSANGLFGGIAVVAGLIGTLSGGYLGDVLVKKNAGGNQLLPAWGMFLATPCYYFCVSATNIYVFSIFLSITLFFVFLVISPINIAFIESIPAKFRNTSMAMAILACHLLGDAISSPIMGYVSDQTGSLRNGILIGTPFLALAGIFWLLGARARVKEVSVPSDLRPETSR